MQGIWSLLKRSTADFAAAGQAGPDPYYSATVPGRVHRFATCAVELQRRQVIGREAL
jgi:hypothetical protein